MNFFRKLREKIDELEKDDDCFACFIVGLVAANEGEGADSSGVIIELVHPFQTDSECAHVMNSTSVQIALRIQETGDVTAMANEKPSLLN